MYIYSVYRDIKKDTRLTFNITIIKGSEWIYKSIIDAGLMCLITVHSLERTESDCEALINNRDSEECVEMNGNPIIYGLLPLSRPIRTFTPRTICRRIRETHQRS